MNNIVFLSCPLAAFLLVTASDARAQDVMCSLSPVAPNYSPLADQPATARAAKDLKTIGGYLCPQGCGRVGLFQNGTIPNIVTVNVGSGASRIEYSPAFLDKVRALFGQDARFGILAHEYGHHVDLNGIRATWGDASWGSEQRADAWAGCALAKAGMKTQGLKEALRVVAAGQPTKSEQSWDQRWGALQTGFDVCGAVVTTGTRTGGVSPLAKGAGGCTSNAECKMGRLCVDGRCENRSVARNTCSKDVDCPEGQLCTDAGRCDAPAGSGQLVTAAVTTKMSSSSTSQPSKATQDPRSCGKECGVERRQCRVGAMTSLNGCLRKITATPAYKDCNCPNFPSSKPACRQLCEEAFDKADDCESNYAPAKEACVGGAPACKDCL